MADDEETYEHDGEFCKMFTLSTGWPLPSCDDMFVEPRWKLKDFQELKTALNETKSKLNFFDLNEWHAHTSKMNPAGLVVNYVRTHVRPDFLTQAWCKFYEIVNTSSLLPDDVVNGGGGVFTVHLCEAPGAFVSSLNHYLAVNHPRCRFKWLAMTLNPYHESNGHPDIVSDDRLILNTLDNWEFGPDYTGDIFQPGYSEHLHRTVSDRLQGNVCLVTADGSVDCSDDPGEQENVVARLHDHETMVALNVLRDGGSFVLKMFTAFECNAICRVYLLCCVFRSVVVRKPSTSKSGNSEVYVVCTGYAGRESALPAIRTFYSCADRGDAAMFSQSRVPQKFLAELHECAKYFADMQTRTIERNVDAWSRKPDFYGEMETVQRSVCWEFVARFGLRRIHRNRRLMHTSDRSHVYGELKPKAWISRRRRGVSFVELTRLRNLDLKQEAGVLYQEIMENSQWRTTPVRDVLWGERECLTVGLSDIRFRLGKPVTVVKGSKFCNETLMRYRTLVLSKFPRKTNETVPDRRGAYFRDKFGAMDATVCDLTEICAENSGDNVAQQYRCLEAMIATLRRLTGDLVVIGYPLYTQMSVACFFAVASMFGKYGFLRPDIGFGHAFAFVGYRKHERWLNALNEAKDYLLPETNKGLALVSWLPIKELLKQQAYSNIVSVNNLCIEHELVRVLSPFMNVVPS